MRIPIPLYNEVESDLRQLVRSLSKAEKSYYKKMSKRYAISNDALHVKLFDLLQNNKNNGDSDLMKQLDIKNQAHFSNTKRYLFNELLEILTFLNRNDNDVNILQNQILQIEWLLKRGLKNSCEKQIKKLKPQTQKTQCFDILIKLIQMQIDLTHHQHKKDALDELRQYNEELLEAYQHQYLFNILSAKRNEILVLKRTSYLRLEAEQLKEVQLITAWLQKLQSEKVTPHTPSVIHILFQSTISLCANMSFDIKLCHASCEKLKQLWKENVELIPIHSNLFLEGANTTFYQSFAVNQLNEVEDNLNYYKPLAKEHLKHENQKNTWEIIEFNTKLKLGHKKADYKMVADIIEQKATAILKITQNTLSASDQLSIITSICISYFVLEKYKEADSLMIDVKELNRMVKREDVYYFCLIFHLIIIYEMKDWYRLSTAADNAYHQLYAKKKIRPFEKELLKFLKQLPTLNFKKNNEEQIERFIRHMEVYKDDPVKKLYFLYFNYYNWFQSKLHQTDYQTYVKGLYQKMNPV